MPEFKAAAVNDEQRELLETLTSGGFSNLAAMSGFFRDEPCVFIVLINEDGVGERPIFMHPLAILIDSEFMKKFGNDMGDPSGRRLKDTRKEGSDGAV